MPIVLGVSRENFTMEVNAKDYGFEPTETPRTDRSVLFSHLVPCLFTFYSFFWLLSFKNVVNGTRTLLHKLA